MVRGNTLICIDDLFTILDMVDAAMCGNCPTDKECENCRWIGIRESIEGGIEAMKEED